MGEQGDDPGYGRHQRWARRILGPPMRALFDLSVTGQEHVPVDGPAVLCANHLAAIDSFIVPSVLERPVLYVGKAEYLDDWKTRWLFPALGMIPIDRRGGDHARAALDTARGVLDGGGLFAIYPEGTRSRTGRLHKGRTGAARLAIETGAPIIPIGLVGTDAVQPIDRAWPRFFRSIEIRFGAPVEVDRYRDRTDDHVRFRQLTDEVMFEIAALSGQEYDHRYATDVAPDDSGPTRGDVVAPIPQRSSAEVLVAKPLPASA